VVSIVCNSISGACIDSRYARSFSIEYHLWSRSWNLIFLHLRKLLPASCENSKPWFKMEGFIITANYSVKKLQFLLFINRMLDTFHLYFYKPEGGSGNETGSRTNGTLWYTSEIDSKYWNCSLSDYWSLKWAHVFVIIVRLIVSLDVACTMKLRDRADSGRTGNWRTRKTQHQIHCIP